MREEEILDLATKVAPSYPCSVERVVGIIDEIIASTLLWTDNFIVDEEHLNKVMWAKALTGQL